ncbi:acyltransferase [Actinomycetaceae bacterium TAE3-ERU4]|nr:acyltransferase [Actinomycetaceae bacterium TAE3-ERU4]
MSTLCSPSPKSAKQKHFRADIQALRAFAVLAVLVNHLSPARLPGGYVGVDIFFVISGFLITFPITRELSTKGKINLGAFYARRIRRLLPAAILVIISSLSLMFFFMPARLWLGNIHEGLASIFYGENIYLFLQSRDYHASNQQVSLFQHYWSLSVEEQFYLVWPLLLLTGFVITHLLFRKFFLSSGKSEDRARQEVGWIGPLFFVSLATIASFIYALFYGEMYPKEAYFFTPIRAWEFALGALIAILVQALQIHHFTWLPKLEDDTIDGKKLLLARYIFSIIGWTMILVSLWSIDEHSIFPGPITLLPTLGAAFVILAGVQTHHAPFNFIWRFYPIRLTGDISYSIYLWHWPLMLLLPYIVGTDHPRLSKIGFVVVVYLLAVLTKFGIEDKGMQWNYWRTSTSRSFILMCLMLVVSLGSGWGLQKYTHYQLSLAANPSYILDSKHCQDPRINSGSICAKTNTPLLSTTIRPSELYSIPDVRQHVIYDVSSPTESYYYKLLATNPQQAASPENPWLNFTPEPQKKDISKPAKRVLIAGDSHSEEYLNAIIPWAVKRHWNLEIFRSSGCPLQPAEYTVSTQDESYRKRCESGQIKLDELLAKNKYDLIIYRAELRMEPITSPLSPNVDLTAEALRKRFETFLASSKQLLVLADTPRNSLPSSDKSLRSPACLDIYRDTPQKCKLPRKVALPPDLAVTVAKELAVQAGKVDGRYPRVATVDVNDVFCDESFCYAAAGGIQFFYDAGHISRTSAHKISPLLQKRGEAALGLP